MNLHKNNPIFVTGVERSGASLIARALSMTGGVWTGSMTGMYENFRLKHLCEDLVSTYSENLFPEVDKVNMDLKASVEYNLLVQGRNEFDENPWMFKSSLLTPLWKLYTDLYPDAVWIVVRRKPTEIVNSCVKTNWMCTFKNPEIRKLVGVTTEEEGWMWLIHKYEAEWVKMKSHGLNMIFVWPDRVLENDFSQLQSLCTDLGLSWNPKIEQTLTELIHKK